jgi:lysozyme
VPSFVVCALLALAGCAGDQGPPGATAPEPESAPPAAPAVPRPDPRAAVHGLDVSEYSGAVDWSKVAAGGFHFAFVKATEGVDLADSAFDDHWPAVRGAGLIRGAYHFFVSEDDPAEQAAFFIAKVDLEPGDLAPVVDVELIGHGTHEGLPERLQTFLDRLEAHYGVKPIIYTSPSFWDAHLTDAFGDYPLWVAEYDVEQPRLPNSWDTWHLWQWQADTAVDGIEKEADLTRVADPEIGLSGLVLD